ncbi:hypothetical protein OBBRIDRAFT_829793, partial [Obba rivulosa]
MPEQIAFHTAYLSPFAHSNCTALMRRQVELALLETPAKHPEYEVDLENKPDWHLTTTLGLCMGGGNMTQIGDIHAAIRVQCLAAQRYVSKSRVLWNRTPTIGGRMYNGYQRRQGGAATG